MVAFIYLLIMARLLVIQKEKSYSSFSLHPEKLRGLVKREKDKEGESR